MKNRKKKNRVIILILFILLALTITISISAGEIKMSPPEILNTLLGNGSKQDNLVVFKLRLPRIIVSILVGIAMSIAGATLQGITKNDLSDPGIIGISSGAGLCVLIYVSMFSTKSNSTVIVLPLLAFIGGLGAATLVYLLSYKKETGISKVRLLLTGVAVNIGINAAILFMTLYLNNNEYKFAELWTAGSIWGAEWRYIYILLPWVVILSTYIFYKSRYINAMNLGENLAIGLGVDHKSEFIKISIAAVALSAGAVSIGGSIIFVGLVAPHISRKLVGSNYKVLIPTTALIGGIFLLLSDTIGKIIMPSTEVPAGIIASIIGAPYFIYLLSKAK